VKRAMKNLIAIFSILLLLSGCGSDVVDTALNLDKEEGDSFSPADTDAIDLAVTDNSDRIDALITLSGVDSEETNLSTFTGDIIDDNQTIKAALQDLEDSVGLVDTEAELEALLDLQDLQGAVTDSQVPNDITIDGENIQDDTIDDDSIDFTDVTLVDFGLAATHDTAAELDALYEAELNNSAGLAAALSDETGTGAAVFSTSPTLVTPILGTITSGVGTALTALNGENIQDDTIDDDSIDFADVTSSDITFDADTVPITAVYSGSTSLEETTAANDSGAYIVGVFDEFGNSASANVQDVLDDLDQAITDGNTDVSSVDSDGEYKGIIDTYTVDAGEGNTSFGQAYHIDTDGELIAADADSHDTLPAIGLACESGTGSKIIITHGVICETDWNWTVGGIVYVSNDPTTTEGLSQSTGVYAQAVGVAKTADCIAVQIGPVYQNVLF
jgi:hypothetical protein